MKKKYHLLMSFILFCFVLVSGIYFLLKSDTVIGNYANAVIEAQYCIPRVASKIGSPANYSSIKNYILTSLYPGLARNDVVKILETIAPIHIGDAVASDDGSSDEIIIKLCTNPLNNLILQVEYSQDSKLIRVYDVYGE